MPSPNDFQPRLGTVAVTFGQNGTYSTVADMGGLVLAGLVAPAWPGAAGSLTMRGGLDPTGTGWPLHTEAGVPYRINPFGSGTFYDLTVGSVPVAPYLILQVGTAGTAGVAAGGTVYLVGRA